MTRNEAWAEGKRLVVSEGFGYAEAAQVVGIPVSTLEKRAAAEGWQKQREVTARYSDQVRALKFGLLEAALKAMQDNKDPSQYVYAWKQAEAAFPEHRYGDANENPESRRRAVLTVIDGLVKYLADKDQAALRVLQPHIQPFAAQMEQSLAA